MAANRRAVGSRGFPPRAAGRLLWPLAAALLLGNVAFGLAARAADEPLLAAHPGRSERLVLAAGLDAGRVVAVDTADRVRLFVDGAPAGEVRFDSLVGALAAAPGRPPTALVGTADGRVVRLDPDLGTIAEARVEGRVVALAPLSGGGLAIAHGEGGYSGQSAITLLDPDLVPVGTSPAEFTVTALAAGADVVAYGTTNARVGLLGLDPPPSPGAVVRLAQPVTALAAAPDGGVFAGGDRGELTRLGPAGEVLRGVGLGQYPVRAIAVDAVTGTAFAADAGGDLYAVDPAGTVLLARPVANADVAAILPAADGRFVVVPREGRWQVLDPAAVDAARRLAALRRGWLATNAALLLAFVAATGVAVDRFRVRAARAARVVGRGRLAYLFLGPAVGLVVLFNYYPAGMAFYHSLTTFGLRAPTEFVGLDNYVEVLREDRYFRTGVLNLAILLATSVVKTVTVPLLAAELVFWLRNAAHRYVFRTLFVLPAVVPDLVFTLMWRQVYDPYTGLLNQLLGVVGLGGLHRAWLGDERTALWAVIGVGFPFLGAFAFLIFLGGLIAINRDYFDAARVDGAGRWARFRHIDLPFLLPQFRILLFFAVAGTVQGFAAIFVLTRGGPGTATYVPALQMYRRIGDGDFGYASAIGVVLFVVVLVLTLAVLRLRRNEAIEAA